MDVIYPEADCAVNWWPRLTKLSDTWVLATHQQLSAECSLLARDFRWNNWVTLPVMALNESLHYQPPTDFYQAEQQESRVAIQKAMRASHSSSVVRKRPLKIIGFTNSKCFQASEIKGCTEAAFNQRNGLSYTENGYLIARGIRNLQPRSHPSLPTFLNLLET